jgi:hypothetical protein
MSRASSARPSASQRCGQPDRALAGLRQARAEEPGDRDRVGILWDRKLCLGAQGLEAGPVGPGPEKGQIVVEGPCPGAQPDPCHQIAGDGAVALGQKIGQIPVLRRQRARRHGKAGGGLGRGLDGLGHQRMAKQRRKDDGKEETAHARAFWHLFCARG